MSLFKRKKSEDGSSDTPQEGNMDINSQLKKIADHLVYLEKKLDQLLGQSRGGSSSGGGYRPYGGGGAGNRYGSGGGSRQ